MGDVDRHKLYHPNNMSGALLTTLLALSLPGVFILNLYFSNPLYEMGVALILWMQQYSTPPLDYFFIFFTAIIDPVFIAVLTSAVTVFMKRRLRAYTFGTFIIFNTYLMTILKCFDAEPRPYWTHKLVRSIGYYCPKDYGSPSGHAYFTSMAACCFIFELIDTKHQKRYAILVTFLISAVSLSRMYLGHHSLDQVVYGLYFGLAISVLYARCGLRQLVKKVLVLDSTTMKSLIWVGILVGYLLSLVGYYANLHQIDSHSKEAKVWMRNFNKKCNRDIDEHYLNHMMLVLNCVSVSNLTGCLLGFRSMIRLPGAATIAMGEWRINDKRFGNKWVSRACFYLAAGVLPATVFLLTKLIPVFFGVSPTTKLIQPNLAILLGVYLFSAYSYPIQRRFNLIELTPAIKDQ